VPAKKKQSSTRRSAWALTWLLMCVTLIALSGCGASKSTNAIDTPTPPEPQHVPEPFTHHQQLVEQGASLILSDGCSACHLDKTTHALGPNFASFAGHDVTLADGRHVLVDEHFVQEALLHPTKNPIAGYDPELMLTAIEHLHLSSRPEQVAALAAFIEQMGPEPG
jgi:hypothetical protein